MHTFDPANHLSDDRAGDLLDQLEVRCSTDVAPLRETEARRRHVHVEVLPGNVCDREAAVAQLQTSELGERTTTGIASRPVMVGSVFLLRFPQDVVASRSSLAVCERCAMLGEDSFELRFRFPSPIELQED